MEITRTSSVHFESICLNNYGTFQGFNEFLFERERTLIMGAGGSGKTTITNAFENLGPTEGIEPYFRADPSEMSVNVITSGDRELVRKYASIIFLDAESALILADAGMEAIFADVLSDNQRITVKDEVRVIFQALLERNSHKVELYEDLNPSLMSFGEKICLGYAYAFALRKAMNLDLPCVFDKE